MEQVLEVLAIEDYSVSQTTLDNVSHSEEINEDHSTFLQSRLFVFVGFC